jgi:BSD domain
LTKVLYFSKIEPDFCSRCALFRCLALLRRANFVGDRTTESDRTGGGNVRTDLTQWQEQHAVRILSKSKVLITNTFVNLVYFIPDKTMMICNCTNSKTFLKFGRCFLLFLKEIAKLRYDLVPGRMKDKQFWNIYFLLVKNYIAS